MKLENLWQRQGEKIFAKLAGLQANGAKLPPLPEGDEKTRQEALNWGLATVITGSSSQVLIERTYEKLLAAGHEILRKRAEAAARTRARSVVAARR